MHTGDRLSLIWKKKTIKNCPQMSTFLICSTLAVAEYRVKRPIWIKNKPEPIKNLTFLSFFFVLVSPKPQMHKKKKKPCHQSSEYAHLFSGYILQMSARRIAYFTIISLNHYWMIENVTWVVTGQSHHLERVNELICKVRLSRKVHKRL